MKKIVIIYGIIIKILYFIEFFRIERAPVIETKKSQAFLVQKIQWIFSELKIFECARKS